jgi:hypothetical protein
MPKHYRKVEIKYSKFGVEVSLESTNRFRSSS